MFDSFWGTTNLKVAAAASAFGAAPRKYDPCTCTIDEAGRKQYTFWFSGGGEEAKKEMELSWSEMKSDAESPIRYVRAALENREAWLGLMKRAEPIMVIKRGEQTLLVPEKSKPDLKRQLLGKM
jgi:hypothetical protein